MLASTSVFDGAGTEYLSVRASATPEQTTQPTRTWTMVGHTKMVPLVACFKDSRSVVAGPNHIARI